MVRRVTTVPADAHGVVTLAGAVSAGLQRDVVQRDVAAGRLRRVQRGTYVRPDAEDPRQAAVRGALTHLGPETVLVLDAAAQAHGLAGTAEGRALHVAVPPGLEKRQRSGLALHFWELPQAHVVTVDGLPVTSIARTLADCCRLLPRFEAVALVDSALHQGLTTTDQFDAITALMARRPGCRTGRRVLREARVGSQSPLETRVRLRASDGGYQPDQLQVPIRDRSGRLLGFGDAGYALPQGGWLILEADGRSVHEAPEAVLRDRARQNAFVSQPDVFMLRFIWGDTLNPRTIPHQIAPILTRFGWRPDQLA